MASALARCAFSDDCKNNCILHRSAHTICCFLQLACAEKELGVAISQEQIDEYGCVANPSSTHSRRPVSSNSCWSFDAHHAATHSLCVLRFHSLAAHLDDIDFEAAAKYEADLRHDVMAHVHTLGDAAPKARPIIHLGATSQFVVCNTELLQVRSSLQLISLKMARVINNLGEFAIKYKDMPTLGFTHYQAAQPVTVGKRATLWAQDFALALEDVTFRLDRLRFRGVRGATGTQASFLCLFDGDASKVLELDKLVASKMDWPLDRRFSVTGQTYPRIVDAQLMNALAVAAAAVHKTCNDIRLLSHDKEIDEPFETNQIGSSAMVRQFMSVCISMSRVHTPHSTTRAVNSLFYSRFTPFHSFSLLLTPSHHSFSCSINTTTNLSFQTALQTQSHPQRTCDGASTLRHGISAEPIDDGIMSMA